MAYDYYIIRGEIERVQGLIEQEKAFLRKKWKKTEYVRIRYSYDQLIAFQGVHGRLGELYDRVEILLKLAKKLGLFTDKGLTNQGSSDMFYL